MKKKLIEFIERYHNESDEVPKMTDELVDIVNFKITTDSQDRRVADFETPLLSALIRKNKFDLAKELIETPGVDFNLADSSGKMPIEYATEKHNDELIALIGEHL